MGFHRQRAVDFTVDNLIQNTAAGSAIRTDRGNKFAIHILLHNTVLQVLNIPIN
jgi:hypothetical protein